MQRASYFKGPWRSLKLVYVYLKCGSSLRRLLKQAYLGGLRFSSVL